MSLFRKIISKAARVRHMIELNKRYSRGHREALDYIASHNPPSLSEREKEEIDQYWSKFGVKFDKYYWHQMYYDITGKKDPRFIPHNFADCTIVPYYNHREMVRAWTDKNYFQRFLPCLMFPEIYGQRIDGKYYDSCHQCYLSDEYEEFGKLLYLKLKEVRESQIIIKQTVNTKQGKGVQKCSAQTEEEIRTILAQNRDCPNFIIQKVIQQDPFFEQFNHSSLNIIRITTWRNGKDIIIMAPCIRYGTPGSITDVSYVDGQEIIQCIGIRENGQIMDYYVTLSGEKKPIHYKIKNVPRWESLIEAVKHAHTYLEYFGIVAWDMTVDKDGNVICIEYNLYSPGTIVYQMAHGPMAKDETDSFMSFLRNKENQLSFLPRKIRRDCKSR